VKYFRALTDAAHHRIHAPIAVEISKSRPAMRAGLLKVLPGRRADVEKAQPAEIRQHLVRLL
jgi:hypothetical protein